MSKADTLGGSSAFGRARTARSSRRSAIENTVGGATAATAAITELPVTVISDNPDNPRDHLRNLEETVQSVREVGVLLPIVVATVDAYLAKRPGRAAELEDGSQYLVVDGHRRLEAARQVGHATIPVRVDDARVATDEALLEAAFVANYHRDDMTDLEEATALQQLVDFYGSQTKAAKRLGIPQGTLSTKLSLLKLSPELQADLLTGTRKVEHVRNLGKLSPEEQKQKADERAVSAARRSAPQTKTVPPTASAESGSDYHGVIIPGNPSPLAGQAQPTAPAMSSAERQGSSSNAESSMPEPATRSEPRTPAATTKPALPTLVTKGAIPWGDPEEVANIAQEWMTPENFAALAKILNDRQA
ncbi:ParB/RepB/Spo0J family partition protein [Streptomyces hebeiensis]